MTERATFGKQERLQYGYEFRRVYQRGRRVDGRLMVVYVCEEAARRRVGIVTSRKIGGAVQRNRARRLLREAYRLQKKKLKDGLQIILVARRAIGGKSLADVQAELALLLAAAGAVQET